jgi:uncharacterized RDD family membrane protein YckC
MNTSVRNLASMTAALLIVLAASLTAEVHAAAPPQVSAPPVAAATASLPDEDSDELESEELNEVDTDEDDSEVRSNNGIVAFSSDAILKVGETADEVVAIFGNATSDGTVAREVVAILGNARVTGPVGREVVAVMGNAYVNSAVDRDVVAVMGNVELGPEAKIGNNVVAIGGTLKRDPAATIGGSTQNISLGPLGSLEGLKVWIKRCALLGRPLALDKGLGWAWGIAAGFLAFYVLLAFLARDTMQRCVTTLEQRPGKALLAALIAIPAVPIAFLLLFMTVVGILAIPVLGMALLCASIFGKAVMLAWIGRRITRPFAAATTADDQSITRSTDWSAPLAVLIGGAVVTVLYLVPILGFVVYKLLGFVGFGVVLCTLLESWQSARATKVTVSAGAAVTSSAPVWSAAPVAATAAPLAATGAAAAAADAESPAVAPAAVSTVPSATALPTAHAGMPRAGFWLRMAALFLDLILVALVSHLAYRLLRIGDPDEAVILWLAVYGAVMWTLKGTTIGGSICGLHLVRTDGKAVDWGTAIMRALGCFLSLIVGGLGFIWIAFDKDQQAWHDKVAGTVVVRTPKGTPIV